MLGLFTLTACEGQDPGGRHQIETSRQVREKPAWDGRAALSSQRFGRMDRGGGHQHKPQMPKTAGPRKAPIAWDVPKGWLQLKPTQMRIGNFGVPTSPGIDCSVSIIPGQGGGVVANVNRWRQQMGLGPTDAAAIDELPKTLILGRPAHVVELEGTYGGMSGSKGKTDWKMVGVIADIQGNSLYVKMTGPAVEVDGERQSFNELAASIRIAAGHMGGAGTPGHGAAPTAGAGADSPAPIEWDAPEEWERSKGGRTRLVTYKAGAQSEVECYVTVLSGTGGGVSANVNLWRSQMGQPKLREDEIAALPTVEIKGRKSPLVEIAGKYQGKDGTPMQDAMMLGAICVLDGHALFFKMIGPAEAVRAERDRFRTFCESVR